MKPSLMLFFSLFPTFAVSQQSPWLVYKVRYLLVTNVSYTTGLQTLENAPQQIGKLRVKIFGEGCRIETRAMYFTKPNSGTMHVATELELAGHYDFHGAQVQGLEFRFHHLGWDQARCSLEFQALDRGEPSDPDWNPAIGLRLANRLALHVGLLTTRLRYSDGYADVVSPAVSFESKVSELVRFLQQNPSRYDAYLEAANLDRQYSKFRRIFFTVHSRHHNVDIDEAWLQAAGAYRILKDYIRP